MRRSLAPTQDNLRASSSLTQSAEAGPKKEPLGQAEGLGLEGLRQPKVQPEVVNHKHHPHGQERETGTEQERRTVLLTREARLPIRSDESGAGLTPCFLIVEHATLQVGVSRQRDPFIFPLRKLLG